MSGCCAAAERLLCLQRGWHELACSPASSSSWHWCGQLPCRTGPYLAAQLLVAAGTPPRAACGWPCQDPCRGWGPQRPGRTAGAAPQCSHDAASMLIQLLLLGQVTPCKDCQSWAALPRLQVIYIGACPAGIAHGCSWVTHMSRVSSALRNAAQRTVRGSTLRSCTASSLGSSPCPRSTRVSSTTAASCLSSTWPPSCVSCCACTAQASQLAVRRHLQWHGCKGPGT